MTLSSSYSAVEFFIDSKTSPYITYNSDLILQNGTEAHAVVTSIKPTSHILIPNVIIGYTYKNGKNVVSDKFETMGSEDELRFAKGDTIAIKVYKNQSVVVDLFSVNGNKNMYLMPLMFLVPTIIFGLLGFLPAIKVYNLYKNGLVKEATIFSMNLVEGLPVFNIGKSVLVDYYYFDSQSNKTVGATSTYNLSIIREKRPDDNIKIFVSETNEAKSCMVPMGLALKHNWQL